MAYFKLDVYKASDAISDFKKYKTNYADDIETFFGSLDNVDSAWTDLNSTVFKDKVDIDEGEILDFLSGINLLCNQMENFNDELVKIITSFGYSSKSCVVKFDDNQAAACKTRLSNVIYWLNNAIYIINKKLLTSDYENKNHLYNLRNQLYNAINITNNIKSNFEKYVNSISNLLDKYNKQINDIDGLDMKVGDVQYQSNIVDLT